MQKNIYVLKLEQEKYFIYFSSVKHYNQILTECEIYYDYAKIYNPLSIIEIIPLTNYLDIDKTVKFYMHLYGYNNVRGGSYIEDILPDYLEKTLNQELKIVEKEEPEWCRLFTEILEKYEQRIFQTMQEIDQEISKISREFQQYKDEKERLENTKFFLEKGAKQNMKDFSPEDMEWLYDICLLHSSNIYNTEINCKKIQEIVDSLHVKKYRTILVFLKQLTTLFEKHGLFQKYGLEKTVYMQYPQFLFDPFIYDTQMKDISALAGTCKTFQHMGNIIYNIIVELEFDVLSYGYGYEWKNPRVLYVLEKKKREFGKSQNIFDKVVM
jgi:hypothetical protein